MRRSIAAAVVLLLGCSKTHEAPPLEGERVEFQIQGDSPSAAYSVAVFVSPTCDIGPMANPLATLFHKGAKACPDLATATQTQEGVDVEFAVRAGKTESNRAGAQGLQLCILNAIDGQPMVSPCNTPLRVLARYRALKPGPTTPVQPALDP